MDRRAMGQETEYGHAIRIGGVAVDPDKLSSIMHGNLPASFLRNGARIYIDINAHLEYATPECDSPGQVAAAALAGDEIVRDLAIKVMAEFKSQHISSMDLQFFRNNVCNYSAGLVYEKTYGTHENYQVATESAPATFVKALLPYLATRQIVVGAGRLLIDKQPEYVFELSQRGRFIGTEIDSSTTNERKPLLNSRDEPHAVGSRRLHLISGDNNLLPQQTALKFAIMDTLLAMLEAGIEMPVSLPNTDQIARNVSRDPNVTFSDYNHRLYTALDIQTLFFEAAISFTEAPSQKLRRPWIERWGRQLTSLTDGFESERHVGQLCWATKAYIVEQYVARHPNVSADRLRQLELALHQVVGSGSMLPSVLERFGEFDWAEVHSLMSLPPRDTRAWARGLAIARGCAVNEWETYFVSDTERRDLNDPLDCTLSA
jgi:proteasome accessory factor A